MQKPHASWAHCYYFAYENTYGSFYQNLTDRTMLTVKTLAKPPCSIVDFGAATGRLSIPLAAAGYDVTAVEPCQEMLDILSAKATSAGVVVKQRAERMQDFDRQGQYDVALCVFTTVLYLLDDDSLRQGLTRMVQSLKNERKILIDIPIREAFIRDIPKFKSAIIERDVKITAHGQDTYIYSEHTRCNINGKWQEYEDKFPIRYWVPSVILEVLQQNGVNCQGPIPKFASTGADYYIGQKKL